MTERSASALDYLHDEIQQLKRDGVFRYPRVLEGAQEPRTVFDGKEVVNLSSNNYLGLANHPKLRQAARDAVDAYGAGSASVRTIAGTMSLHTELERRLAAF